ncbi:hypothetical protein AALP_AA6G156100 [Arabis alpina]|uniref:Thioredoxin n=1 Tax=Arabis alpina TaxID=50452 RepID=A0A087GPG1_ARAAL|nr:hypothetical protein AALP_AA6G156100 [Arabis alpina]
MAAQGEVIVPANASEFTERLKLANESKKLIVIDFTATWCPPCRMIAPIFVEYAKKFVDVVFFKVDVDELQAVAKEFEVEAMPTFVYMREGVVIDKVVGAAKEEIQAKLEQHSAAVAAV